MLLLHVVFLLLYFHFWKRDGGAKMIFLNSNPLFKASVSWSKVLNDRVISDRRRLWAAEPETAIREIAAINSSLSSWIFSSCDFFRSYALVCSSATWIWRYWFTRNFSCCLRAASFCFRFAFYFLSVASLVPISILSLNKSCSMSRFLYKPTSILFSVLMELQGWELQYCW